MTGATGNSTPSLVIHPDIAAEMFRFDEMLHNKQISREDYDCAMLRMLEFNNLFLEDMPPVTTFKVDWCKDGF